MQRLHLLGHQIAQNWQLKFCRFVQEGGKAFKQDLCKARSVGRVGEDSTGLQPKDHNVVVNVLREF
jgi:hypothetical protein